ncbi:MAG: hypothetical protein ACRBFS_08990 [Aureispira sp.]
MPDINTVTSSSYRVHCRLILADGSVVQIIAGAEWTIAPFCFLQVFKELKAALDN